MREAERLGLDTLVEAHDAGELARATRLGAPVIGVNARDLSTFRIDRRAQLALVARRRQRDRVVIAECGDPHARAGRRRGARRRGRRPRRHLADAGARPGREAARPALAPAREGLRPDPPGGRRRRGRGRRRPARLHPRGAQPAPRRRRPRRPRHGALGRRLRRRGRGHRRRPRAALPATTAAPSAAATPCCSATASPSRACSTCRGRAHDPDALASAPRRPRDASCSPAASAPRTSARRSRPSHPWAVDAASSLEREPGIKDHDARPRLRRGGARMMSTTDVRRLRRPLRPGDADPGARRARAGLARGARRRLASTPSCTSSRPPTRAGRRRSRSRSGSRPAGGST